MKKKKNHLNPENPLDISVMLRLDKETDKKIKYCMEKLNTTRSDVLRKGVNFLYAYEKSQES